jgi:hypothetical protein
MFFGKADSVLTFAEIVMSVLAQFELGTSYQ